jgi:hypothetical protein
MGGREGRGMRVMGKEPEVETHRINLPLLSLLTLLRFVTSKGWVLGEEERNGEE